MSHSVPEINYLKLKNARELAGLSQVDLAKSLCLGKAHIEQIESNQSDIYFSPAHKIQVA
jgi:transcriptional regulator with XRE-family HTH domain